MKQITFGTYKSYDDLHLILASKRIGSPKPKIYKVKVEGADGELDYTEYFGGTKFENVQLEFEFSTIVVQSQFLELFSAIKNALHGQKMKIVLDDDPDFYYIGRITVSDFTNSKAVGNISISCDCEPWKYKKDITTVSGKVSYDLASGGGETILINLINSRKKVVPEITTTAPAKIEFGGHTTNVGEGTFRIPELELVEGWNIVSVTATTTKSGTITFTYQEGGL